MACALVPAVPLCNYSSESRKTFFPTEFLGSGFIRLNSVSQGVTRSRRATVSPPTVVVTRAKATTPSDTDPMTADALQEKFGCQGARFVVVDGSPGVELKVRNGSTLKMLLPRAHIISYKANMWHGGEEEMLHTVRLQSGSLTSTSSLRGGIELRFNQLKDPLSSILPSPSSPWRVESVDCQPSEYAQITMTNTSYPEGAVGQSGRGLLQFRYVVTLCDDSVSAAVVISNTGPVAVDFTGSIMSHIGVSSANGAFAVGLKGYRYRSLVKQKQKSFDTTRFFSQLWSSSKDSGATEDEMVVESSGRDSRQELEGGTWIVESEDYSQLHGGMDRLYATPPDSFSVMDRGRRRSLVFERHGFPEFCLSNPGPDSKSQDWNKFVSVGPTQSCQSVRLYENREWRGAVTLLNRGAGDGELQTYFQL